MDRHLAEGCPICQSEIARNGDLLALWARENELAAPPLLRQRLLRSLREKANLASKAVSPVLLNRTGLLLLRTSEMEWKPASPGLWAKVLVDDSENDMTTTLVRMGPDSLYPSHRHKGVEEVYLLEGELRVEGIDLAAGDFCVSQPESIHQSSYSRSGCLLVVRSSKHDEVLG